MTDSTAICDVRHVHDAVLCCPPGQCCVGCKAVKLMLDAAPAMIWQSGIDQQPTYFNKRWLDFTGRTIAEERGIGWAERVHPDDVQRRLAVYTEAFDLRRDFEMEYRLRRHDGEYRWVLDRGAPFQDLDGSFAGYLGGCIDITERRRAEAVKNLEIVELQDHALQTFFVIGLVVSAALTELPPDRITEPVGAALAHVGELAASGSERLREAIFALNHGEVEQRGVVSSLWRLVRDFQSHTAIDADLVVKGGEIALPPEVAETLHAVGREALSNVERHSHASAVVLGLHVTPRMVTLSIQDDGARDARSPKLKRIADSATHFGLRGVGLRVRRLGGTLVAQPARDGGFVVRMRIPLTPPTDTPTPESTS
jgi:PAS domain S-box-containing protein